MPGLAEVVRGLAARDGVDAVVLVSPDGLPIDHAARGACDADETHERSGILICFLLQMP